MICWILLTLLVTCINTQEEEGSGEGVVTTDKTTAASNEEIETSSVDTTNVDVNQVDTTTFNSISVDTTTDQATISETTDDSSIDADIIEASGSEDEGSGEVTNSASYDMSSLDGLTNVNLILKAISGSDKLMLECDFSSADETLWNQNTCFPEIYLVEDQQSCSSLPAQFSAKLLASVDSPGHGETIVDATWSELQGKCIVVLKASSCVEGETGSGAGVSQHEVSEIVVTTEGTSKSTTDTSQDEVSEVDVTTKETSKSDEDIIKDGVSEISATTEETPKSDKDLSQDEVSEIVVTSEETLNSEEYMDSVSTPNEYGLYGDYEEYDEDDFFYVSAESTNIIDNTEENIVKVSSKKTNGRAPRRQNVLRAAAFGRSYNLITLSDVIIISSGTSRAFTITLPAIVRPIVSPPALAGITVTNYNKYSTLPLLQLTGWSYNDALYLGLVTAVVYFTVFHLPSLLQAVEPIKKRMQTYSETDDFATRVDALQDGVADVLGKSLKDVAGPWWNVATKIGRTLLGSNRKYLETSPTFGRREWERLQQQQQQQQQHSYF